MTSDVATLLAGNARWWLDRRWCEHVADFPHNPEVIAMAGLGARLRRGDDPAFVVGSTVASDALARARDWLYACIPPMDVALWVAAGCNRPESARLLVHQCIYPQALLDENGEPAARTFLDIGGRRITAACAVAEDHMSAVDAARFIRGR